MVLLSNRKYPTFIIGETNLGFKMRNLMDDIEGFLNLHRLAMVGVSSNPRDFSRKLFQEFITRGYDLHAVNPKLDEIEGIKCVNKIQEITPVVEGAIILTSPENTSQIVLDAASMGIKHLWIFNQKGFDRLEKDIIDLCYQKSMKIIAGACPFMFFQNTQWIHRLHGWMLKITGQYPK